MAMTTVVETNLLVCFRGGGRNILDKQPRWHCSQQTTYTAINNNNNNNTDYICLLFGSLAATGQVEDCGPTAKLSKSLPNIIS